MVLTNVLGLTLALLELAAPNAAKLRAEATRELRAGRIERACALFREAADAAPGDGAVQADLGLCYEKLGRREQAVAAARKAIALGDERTRRNAYHNLGKAGAVVRVPTKGSCEAWRSEACAAVLHSCAFGWEALGNRGGTRGVGLRVTYDEAQARAVLQDPDAEAEGAVEIERGRRSGAVLNLDLQSRSAAYCADPPVPGGLRHALTEKGPERDCDARERLARCAVVHVDPCTGRIGISCQEAARGVTSSRATEFELRRPEVP